MTRIPLLTAGAIALATLASSQQICTWDLPAGFVGDSQVSSMSILEHDILVGYPFAENASGWAAGRVRLLNRGLGGELTDLGWLDSPSPGTASQGFGTAISRDDAHIAVTSPGEQVPGSPFPGAVFIFRQSSAVSWTLDDTVNAPASQPGDNFGASTALEDGWLFVAAPYAAGAGLASGAVYVYQDSAAGWSHTQTLRASNAADPNRAGFGFSLDIDAGRLVVGSYSEQSLDSSSGAYVFEQSGGVWTETIRFDGIPGGGISQAFGRDVSISGDVIVVGASGHVPGPGSTAQGAAAVFQLDPQSGWVPSSVLRTEAYGTNESYGIHVDVDRGRVLVAAWESTSQGLIEVWGRACGGWHQSHRLGSPFNGGVPPNTTTFTGLSGDVVITAHEALLGANHLTCTRGRSYCDPNTENATGLAGRLRADGSTTVTDNGLSLMVSQMPPMSAGLLFFSRTPSFTPMQSCTTELCLGGTIARGSAQALSADGNGDVHYSFDATSLPPVVGGGPVVPGETWYFQYVHRNPDPVLPLAFTNAVTVTFD